MKKAYNELWVNNLAVRRVAKRWTDKKLISEAQFEAVQAEFPERFYLPGIFIKIGLFIFTAIACAFFVGFISLSMNGKGFAGISLICCLCFTGTLEFLIKDRRLFHSGVDNALLYAAVISSITPFLLLFENNWPVWQYCLVALVILSLAVLRYADLLATTAWYGILLTLLANVMMQYPLGKALLPFAIMVLSAFLYFLAKKTTNSYYRECKLLMEALSLSAFYLGGNYYVVREGNALLGDTPFTVAPQISFAYVFYALTFIIPLSYIFFGLKKKNRILLLTGLFSLGFSIFTYHYYFGFLTIAQGLALVGFLMILITVWAINYLKVPRHALADEPDTEQKTAELGALLASQYPGQAASPQQGPEFGAGSFGGGGAGNDY